MKYTKKIIKKKKGGATNFLKDSIVGSNQEKLNQAEREMLNQAEREMINETEQEIIYEDASVRVNNYLMTQPVIRVFLQSIHNLYTVLNNTTIKIIRDRIMYTIVSELSNTNVNAKQQINNFLESDISFITDACTHINSYFQSVIVNDIEPHDNLFLKKHVIDSINNIKKNLIIELKLIPRRIKYLLSAEENDILINSILLNNLTEGEDYKREKIRDIKLLTRNIVNLLKNIKIQLNIIAKNEIHILGLKLKNSVLGAKIKKSKKKIKKSKKKLKKLKKKLKKSKKR
jgi:hypothetical protein